MKDVRRILFQFISLVVFLGLVQFLCMLILAIVFGLQDVVARWQINQHLIEIDQQFTNLRNQLPLDLSPSLLYPQQVGDFERQDATDSDELKCLFSDYSVQPCFRANYRSDANNAHTNIHIKALQPPEQIDVMQGDIQVRLPCGGRVVYFTLRAQSKLPYLYGGCSLGIATTSSINYLVWENSNWLIEVEGNYETIRQFIAAYPY